MSALSNFFQWKNTLKITSVSSDFYPSPGEQCFFMVKLWRNRVTAWNGHGAWPEKLCLEARQPARGRSRKDGAETTSYVSSMQTMPFWFNYALTTSRSKPTQVQTQFCFPSCCILACLTTCSTVFQPAIVYTMLLGKNFLILSLQSRHSKFLQSYHSKLLHDHDSTKLI